jgi:malate synthase
LGGNGCVPLYNLMEDAATAEISRAQCWQWLRHTATLEDGRTVTPELFETLFNEELMAIRAEVGDERFEGGSFAQASELFASMCKAPEFAEFLTLPAYEYLP